MEMDYELQVVVAAGPEEPRKAILGLSMAASAASSGARVFVYFVMDGARCLLPANCSRTLAAGYPAVSELLEVVRDSGGTIAFCPNCLDQQCTPPAINESLGIRQVCHLAHPGGIAAVGVRMTTIPTVVF